MCFIMPIDIYADLPTVEILRLNGCNTQMTIIDRMGCANWTEKEQDDPGDTPVDIFTNQAGKTFVDR